MHLSTFGAANHHHHYFCPLLDAKDPCQRDHFAQASRSASKGLTLPCGISLSSADPATSSRRRQRVGRASTASGDCDLTALGSYKRFTRRPTMVDRVDTIHCPTDVLALGIGSSIPIRFDSHA